MARRKWTREEIENYRKEHGRIGYFNREDSNLFVPKAYGFGRTLNWANPIFWIVILVVLAFIVWRVYPK